MKAMCISGRSLVWSEVPDLILKPDEVEVEVIAAGVNRADLLQRRGLYPPPEGASEILGMEVSGVISRVGKDVNQWKVGDRVTSLIEGGGYAERVAIPAGYLLPVPESLDLTEAAALPEVYITAFLNIYLEGQLKPEETLLVHAAASGVGTAAIQICKLFGNRVFGTASTKKIAALEELGIDMAIDRTKDSFLDVICSTEKGVDVVLDLVGGNYFEDNLKVLKSNGRVVTIGLLGGVSSSISLNLLMTKRLRVIGSVLRSRSKDEKIKIIEPFKEKVWPHYLEGRISPVIDSVFSIHDAERAHEKLKNNDTVGKVLLMIEK